MHSHNIWNKWLRSVIEKLTVHLTRSWIVTFCHLVNTKIEFRSIIKFVIQQLPILFNLLLYIWPESSVLLSWRNAREGTRSDHVFKHDVRWIVLWRSLAISWFKLVNVQIILHRHVSHVRSMISAVETVIDVDLVEVVTQYLFKVATLHERGVHLTSHLLRSHIIIILRRSNHRVFISCVSSDRLCQLVFFARRVKQALFLKRIEHLLVMLHGAATLVLLIDLNCNILHTILIVEILSPQLPNPLVLIVLDFAPKYYLFLDGVVTVESVRDIVQSLDGHFIQLRFNLQVLSLHNFILLNGRACWRLLSGRAEPRQHTLNLLLIFLDLRIFLQFLAWL